MHEKLGSVYAFVPELEAWRSRRAKYPAAANDQPSILVAAQGNRVRRFAISAASFLLALIALWLWMHRSAASRSRSNEFPRPLTSWLGTQTSPSFSPDGSSIAFTWDGERRDNFDIYVISATGGTPQRLTAAPDADYSPAWSPDGKSIAFLRCPSGGTADLMLMPATGGPERVLAKLSTRASVQTRDVSWSPDGKWLAVTDLIGSGSASRTIFAIPATGGAARPLARPVPGASYAQPAISPDGRAITFICTSAQGGGSFCQMPITADGDAAGDVRTVPIHGFQNGSASLFPVWTGDGRSIIFSSMKFGVNRLWRVRRDGGEPELIAATGERATLPAISAKAHRLAYTRRLYSSSVWTLDIRSSPAAPSQLISSTHPDLAAQYSPGGSRIAFASEQTGIAEVWLANRDGSHQVQLTRLKEVLTGDPMWSPDGQRIAFDSIYQGHSQIYIVDLHGGEPVRAVTDSSVTVLPSWSPDGAWLYFSSDRGGNLQIWRVAIKGGQPEQVTSDGGFASAFSPDGRWLYYTSPSQLLGGRPMVDLDRNGIARTIRADTTVWRMPAQGGAAVRVADHVRDRCFATAKDGVYVIRRESQMQQLVFYPIDKGAEPRVIAALPQALLPGLSISPDGTTAMFTIIDQNNVNIMMLDDFQ